MTLEKIQELDKEILDLYQMCLEGTQAADVKNNLRNRWDKIKNDEETLSAAIKIVNPDNAVSINFAAPSIIGLSLIDYENVDKIAYDVITRKIFNNKYLCRRENPLLSEYAYSYLVTCLFNKNLLLPDKIKNNLLLISRLSDTHYHTNKEIEYITYWIYMHPVFNEDEKRHLLYAPLISLLENYDERIKLRRLTKLPF